MYRTYGMDRTDESDDLVDREWEGNWKTIVKIGRLLNLKRFICNYIGTVCNRCVVWLEANVIFWYWCNVYQINNVFVTTRYQSILCMRWYFDWLHNTSLDGNSHCRVNYNQSSTAGDEWIMQALSDCQRRGRRWRYTSGCLWYDQMTRLVVQTRSLICNLCECISESKRKPRLQAWRADWDDIIAFER